MLEADVVEPGAGEIGRGVVERELGMVEAQELNLLARRDTVEHERHVIGHPILDAHVVGDGLA